MSGHTPGPWSVWPNFEDDGARVLITDDALARHVAFAESGANARLIAAAPDQNEALIDIDGRLEAIVGALEGLLIFGKRDKKVRDAIRTAEVLVRGSQRIARAAIAKAQS